MRGLPENGSITHSSSGGASHLLAVLGNEAEESRSPAEHQVQEVVRQIYVDQTEQQMVSGVEAGDEAQHGQQQVDDAHPLQVGPRPPYQNSSDAEDAEQQVHQVVEHVHSEDAEQLTPRRVQDEAQEPYRQEGHPEHRGDRSNHNYSLLSFSRGRGTRASDRWRALLTRLFNADTKIAGRSEEHTSELQSRQYFVCPLLLEKNPPTPTSAW